MEAALGGGGDARRVRYLATVRRAHGRPRVLRRVAMVSSERGFRLSSWEMRSRIRFWIVSGAIVIAGITCVAVREKEAEGKKAARGQLRYLLETALAIVDSWRERVEPPLSL